MDASVKHFSHKHACPEGSASASARASATASTDVDTDNDTDSSLSQEAGQDTLSHVCNVSSADERIQKAIMAYANQPDTFRVLDQGINGKVWGTDSIGATFICGKGEVEKLYWCGSLFTDQDEHHPYFTPTTVQVAAGVLSGLSYIMEPEQANRGWFESSDLDTGYMLEKAVPLLGHFFFTEVPMSAWDGDYSIQVTPLI
jgi:homospermidine synthase